MNFSENIDVSASGATLVQLGDDSSGTNNITLSAPEITESQSDGTTLTFTLTDADRDAIASWNSAGKTALYVKLTSPAVKDMSGNGISTTSWTAIDTWTKDTAGPTLVTGSNTYSHST